MRRIFFVDDNIATRDGHYLEIATLMRDAASELGYQTSLAVHKELPVESEGIDGVDRIFSVNRMLRWSLGVDGKSFVGRDSHGRPLGGSQFRSQFQRALQAIRDRMIGKEMRPKFMLDCWVREFSNWMREQSVGADDVLVFNTADDFQMLAIERALNDLKGNAPREVHLLFHFALYEEATPGSRAIKIGQQINRVIGNLGQYRIQLHATTESLTQQLGSVGVAASTIAYPIRPVAARETIGAIRQQESGRLNVLFGGWPRREKGVRSITNLLASIGSTHLEAGRIRVSMQLPLNKWKQIVPASLHAECSLRDLPPRAEEHQISSSIELITSSVPPVVYQGWLNTADIGLFLYEPRRYVARCSAVLLELMVRGVPVIVPNECWLADQVREANSQGAIGLIYDSIDDIPELLTRMADKYLEFQGGANRHAQVIADRHTPAATLRAMGIGGNSHELDFSGNDRFSARRV